MWNAPFAFPQNIAGIVGAAFGAILVNVILQQEFLFGDSPLLIFFLTLVSGIVF